MPRAARALPASLLADSSEREALRERFADHGCNPALRRALAVQPAPRDPRHGLAAASWCARDRASWCLARAMLRPAAMRSMRRTSCLSLATVLCLACLATPVARQLAGVPSAAAPGGIGRSGVGLRLTGSAPATSATSGVPTSRPGVGATLPGAPGAVGAMGATGGRDARVAPGSLGGPGTNGLPPAGSGTAAGTAAGVTGATGRPGEVHSGPRYPVVDPRP